MKIGLRSSMSLEIRTTVRTILFLTSKARSNENTVPGGLANRSSLTFGPAVLVIRVVVLV